MKIKNKGKVYPSPSSSSSSSSSSSFTGSAIKDRDGDVLSILKLLPAAILALASVLSLEDREVLAYMITRSLKTTTNPNPSSFSQDSKKKSSKKLLNARGGGGGNDHNGNHKAPNFDCECFDCYTSYWFRWDSSPNRELIHQVIEAFEDHLTNGEQSKKSGRGKRKEKASKRVNEKSVLGVLGRPEMAEKEVLSSPEIQESSFVSPDDGAASPGIAPDGGKVEEEKRVEENEEKVVVPKAEEETTVVLRSPPAVSNHKGLARKVLPDVMGLLNSRLWSLWGPNV